MSFLICNAQGDWSSAAIFTVGLAVPSSLKSALSPIIEPVTSIPAPTSRLPGMLTCPSAEATESLVALLAELRTWKASVTILRLPVPVSFIYESLPLWYSCKSPESPSLTSPSSGRVIFPPVTSIPLETSKFPVTWAPEPVTKNLSVPDLVAEMLPLFATDTFDVPFAICVLSIAVVEAAVTRPWASTVTIGIAELEPYWPAVTPEFSSFVPAIEAVSYTHLRANET